MEAFKAAARRVPPPKPALERKQGSVISIRLQAAVLRRLDALVDMVGRRTFAGTNRHAMGRIALLKGLEWLEEELPKRLATQ
jgi:hypothetical protein